MGMHAQARRPVSLSREDAMEHRGAVALRVERAIAEDCFVLVAVGVLDGGSAQGLCERVTDALADGGAVALDLAALESCDERAAFMLAQLTARRVAPNRSRISL